MRQVGLALVFVAVLMVAAQGMALASTYSIPNDKIDVQKVYYGSADGFDKAGKVDYEAIIRATPEYKEVKKKKVRRGTGKYWILLSKASDRAVRAIAEVGHESEYDLVTAEGFLSGLDPAIPSEDITGLVLAKFEKGQTKGKRR